MAVFISSEGQVVHELSLGIGGTEVSFIMVTSSDEGRRRFRVEGNGAGTSCFPVVLVDEGAGSGTEAGRLLQMGGVSGR